MPVGRDLSGSSSKGKKPKDAKTPLRPRERAIEHQVQPMIGGDRPVGEPVGGYLDDLNIPRKLGLDVTEMTGELESSASTVMAIRPDSIWTSIVGLT